MLPRIRTRGASSSQVMAGAAESPLHGDDHLTDHHDSSDHDGSSPRSPPAAAMDASATSGAFAREVAFAYLHHKHSTSPQPQQQAQLLPRAASTEQQMPSPRGVSAAGTGGSGAHLAGHLMVARRSKSEFGGLRGAGDKALVMYIKIQITNMIYATASGDVLC
jgi:hypothetical protein